MPYSDVWMGLSALERSRQVHSTILKDARSFKELLGAVMNEKIDRLQTIQNNIARCERLLKSNLSSTEVRFVEKRLSEEKFALAMTQFMGPGNLPGMIEFP
jgi:replication fork clamp-binding protein CrfC